MIKLGEFVQEFPKDSQIYMEAQGEFTIIELDEADKPARILGTSKNRELKFIVRKDCKLKVIQPKLSHLSIDARSIKPVHEVVSDIPVEIDVDLEPMGLEQKIKQFCAQLVQHEYGINSPEVDQFEESFDFDIPEDDDVILTGHEVIDMEPEVPIEPIENTAPAVENETVPEAPQNTEEAAGETPTANNPPT